MKVTKDFAVKQICRGSKAATDKGVATCGTCNRMWNDTVSTGWTPVPAGRCPFEYFH